MLKNNRTISTAVVCRNLPPGTSVKDVAELIPHCHQLFKANVGERVNPTDTGIMQEISNINFLNDNQTICLIVMKESR